MDSFFRYEVNEITRESEFLWIRINVGNYGNSRGMSARGGEKFNHMIYHVRYTPARRSIDKYVGKSDTYILTLIFIPQYSRNYFTSHHSTIKMIKLKVYINYYHKTLHIL